MKYLKISALAFTVLALYACRYDKADELYVTPDCDTTVSTTFSQYVSTVVDNNCLECHSNANNATLGGSINLDGYANLINYVNDGANGGSFLGSIKHDPNYLQMPDGGAKLDDCTIQKLEKWINNGAQDN